MMTYLLRVHVAQVFMKPMHVTQYKYGCCVACRPHSQSEITGQSSELRQFPRFLLSLLFEARHRFVCRRRCLVLLGSHRWDRPYLALRCHRWGPMFSSRLSAASLALRQTILLSALYMAYQGLDVVPTECFQRANMGYMRGDNSINKQTTPTCKMFRPKSDPVNRRSRCAALG